jgi:type II secretion system protein N
MLAPLLFVASLLFFLFQTFPYETLSQRISSEARTAGYDLTIGALSHAGLLGLSATDVHIKAINADTASGPLELKLEKLVLKPELLGLLLRRTAVAFNVEAYGGNAHGLVRVSNDPKAPGLSALQLSADAFDLKSLPPSLVEGIEMIGQLGIQADVSSLQALEGSAGTISFALKGSALVKGTVMGFPLPKVMLGDLTGSMAIDKGVAKLEKMQLRGGDVDAEFEGTVRLKPLLMASQADLKVHLKPKESWLDANPLVKGSIGFLGPKQGDGYWVSVTGPLSHLAPRPGK